MCRIEALKIICSIQFCVFLIIIHMSCIDRTLAKYTQSGEDIHKSSDIQMSKSSQEAQKFSRLEQLKAFHWRIKDCVKHTNNSTWNCFKTSTLHAFDELTTAAVIPIWNGIRFVRSNEPIKVTKIRDEMMTYQRQDLQHITWFDSLAMRLAKMFHTHVLEINFNEMADVFLRNPNLSDSKSNNSKESIGEARFRRHRQNMMITMMFGVTALGAILVPMGFQLLSVVSGKALLLAKMALLLASINGLKRVANSGVHYGLYQVPGEHYGGYYERNDLHHPRNVAGLTIAQPIEYGIRK